MLRILVDTVLNLIIRVNGCLEFVYPTHAV